MFNLHELEQFVLFGELGSLTAVAEKLNLSVPTLTRSMKNVESEFGVSLFNRTKNRMSLNKTGKEAVSYARHFLAASNSMVNRVKNFDESLKLITIRSCDTKPLMELLNYVSEYYPDMRVDYKVSKGDEMETALLDDDVDIYIMSYMLNNMKSYKIFQFKDKTEYFIAIKDNDKCLELEKVLVSL